MQEDLQGADAAAAVAADLRRFIAEEALPLWSGTGRDRVHGGVHERLHLDGSPDLACAKRLRVQARQIYVYAHADALGWCPGGRQVAFDILEFMLEAGRSPDGRPGYVHLLAPDGAVADPRRDAYDHMFVLLALAWLARASGDAQVRSLVDETLDLVEDLFDDGAGGLIESVPPALPRRQNPHMHAFEAMLALHETLEHAAASPRAARLRELLEAQFLCPETGLLLEHFDADLKRLATPEGDVVEPGHMVEWAWLLRRQESLFGLPRGPLARRLLDDGLRFADPNTGFLPDEARRSGATHRATRRCWPQTELAKAWIAEAEARRDEPGREEARAAACAALRRLRSCYLAAPVAGGWIDQFDGGGRPIAAHVPASTLYHVFGAVVEADRVFAAAG